MFAVLCFGFRISVFLLLNPLSKLDKREAHSDIGTSVKEPGLSASTHNPLCREDLRLQNPESVELYVKGHMVWWITGHSVPYIVSTELR
jgi:hypothetical protein